MDYGQDTGGVVLDRAFLRDVVEGGRKTRKARPRPRLRRLFALAAGCALAGFILARGGGPALIDAPASAPLSQISFIADERLAPMMAFAAPEGDRAQAHYVARSRPTSGERWDTLTFGEPDAGDLLFRVTLRSTKSSFSRSSLFVALAKQSAELGAAVVHATSPQFGETALGPIEWAEITLADRRGERPCLGFRAARSADIDLSGFACGGGGASLERVALECLIGRLAPTDAGLEAGLGEVLKSGAARKATCPRVVG